MLVLAFFLSLILGSVGLFILSPNFVECSGGCGVNSVLVFLRDLELG